MLPVTLDGLAQRFLLEERRIGTKGSRNLTMSDRKVAWHVWHTHTHPFNGPLSGTTQVSQYQKGKTNPDFTEARDSEWQWH